MLKRFFLPTILLLLSLVFWFSPHFKDIAAGVAILLFGMITLENGFKSLTEGPLKRLLSKATNKFYKSFSLGMVSTAILQSSSLISVITISFISTGLLSLTQGVGIIFGANLGTTATAWLVAILGLKMKISALAMPMLVFGIILVFQKQKSLKGIGNVLAGLGFLFLGIHFMKEGFDLYKEGFNLADYAMTGAWGVIVFASIGLLATIVLQSSSATMAVILTALAAGQITYFNSLALAIGANVGTTVTAIIGAMASNAAGKRLAGAHLIFNVVTAIIALALVNQLAWIVDWLAALFNFNPSNYTLKLAIFHTIFNLLGVVVMFPFVGKLVKFLENRVKEEVYEVENPIYLTEAALAYPQSAIAALVKETKHLFENVFEILAHGLGLHRVEVLKKDFDASSLKPISKFDIDKSYYKRVKNIYGKIIEFAARAQEQSSDAEYIQTIYNIKEANRYFVDAVKDVKDLQTNLLKYTTTDNPVMRNEYNIFRFKISKIIRQVFKAQKLKLPPDKSINEINELVAVHIETRRKKLTKQLLRRRKDDVLFNGKIDHLIREKSINTAMASSLMNDSALTAAITKHLIKATELLYLDPDILLTEVDVKNGTKNTNDE
ncbi:MAG: Na/Pi cotransporter family protein [Bacteroidetes bacterium]|nr:MAG: Na/Pi cotransporter family protein [Bacteroidota bacterium]